MPLTRLQLLGYGASGLPLAALGLPFYVYLPTQQALVLGPVAVGLALLAARLFDVVSDPLIGHWSDRLRAPAWRRRGPMLLGLPLLLLGIDWLFRSPGPQSAWALTGAALLAYLGWTLINVPYQAWGAELSTQPHQRARAAAAREGGVILGTLIAVVLPWWWQVADTPDATLARMRDWLLWSLPLALLLTLALTPVRRVAEHAAPPPRTAPWRALLQRPALRRLLLAQVLNGIANGIPATLFLFYVVQVLDAEQAVGLLLVTYFASGVLSLPLWLALARRLGRLRVWAGAMALACLAFAPVPWLGSGDLIAFFVVCLLSGAALGADMALPAAVQAELAAGDADRGRPAGLYFGFWSLATKLAQALAVGIALPLLGLAGFDPGAQSQTPLALAVLIGAYAGAPLLFKLATLWVVHRLAASAPELNRIDGVARDETPPPVLADDRA